MKKYLLLSATAAVYGSAVAASGFPTADPYAFSAPVSLPETQSPVGMQTRAEGGMETFDYTYAYSPAGGTSLNNAQGGVTRVYMGFEMSAADVKAFKGRKVTGFKVYSPYGSSGGANTIKDGRFFYSFGEGKAEYSQDFTLTATPQGLNNIELTEPYTITGEEPGIIFGYSIVVPTLNSMLYLIVDGQSTTSTAGLYSSTNSSEFPKTFYSFADQLGALCMSVTLEGETFPNLASFATFPSPICLPLGQASSFPVTLSATSAAPIDSITVEYSLGGELNRRCYHASNSIPAGVNRNLDINLEFPALSDNIKEVVDFRITKINDSEASGEGSAVQSTVLVVNEVPVHQALFEEYTSLGCRYCPRGFAALEYIKKNHPEFVTASFHSEYMGTMDIMQITTNFPTRVSSYPAAVLNRTYQMDPYFGNSKYMDLKVPIVGDVLALNAVPTVWNIKVAHEWESEDVLVAKTEVVNVAGYEDGGYRIAYLLVADGLTGKTAAWIQSNGLATMAPSSGYADELNAFCRGGEYGKARVIGLVFNDVVVSSDGIHGVEGSLPASLAPEEAATHSLKFDLAKISKNLIPDKNKLRVIAAVIGSQGQVLNCAKDEVNDFTENAVDGIFDVNAPAEYYNLNGIKVSEPTPGIYIRRQGTKTEKVIIR